MRISEWVTCISQIWWGFGPHFVQTLFSLVREATLTGNSQAFQSRYYFQPNQSTQILPASNTHTQTTTAAFRSFVNQSEDVILENKLNIQWTKLKGFSPCWIFIIYLKEFELLCLVSISTWSSKQSAKSEKKKTSLESVSLNFSRWNYKGKQNNILPIC